MKLLLWLFVGIAKFLIAIGDFVILVFNAILAFFKNLGNAILDFYTRVDEEIDNQITKTKNLLRLNPGKFRKKTEVTVYKLGKVQKVKVRRIRRSFFRSLSYLNEGVSSFFKPVTLHLSSLGIPKFRKARRGRKYRLPTSFKLKYFLFGVLASFVFLFLPTIGWIFVQNLPNPRQMIAQDVAQTTKIYDRRGRLLYQIYADQNRTLIPLSEIPANLKNATIAIEDKNFYTTPGVDLQAIARSAFADLTGEPLQGGSTITQQLVRSRLLSPERTITRKVKEIILSVWTERIYSKNQILEMYLNQVPYGGTAWGIEAAAQTYFGKHAKELDLAQSAFLAGLPQAPSVYSPYGENPILWKERQRDVLQRMVDLRYISKAEAQKADREMLSFLPPAHILHAPYFVMYVKDLLVQKYGINMVERGGLNVTTSLDLDKQSMAEKVVQDEVSQGAYLNFTNGAALITNPSNGDILAMVGGKNYYEPGDGNFNVTTALRQPGSTIKVVTYTAALMNGFTAATPIVDSPVSFSSPGSPPYAPVNYDGQFHGTLTLRSALGNSVNIPAVKTLNKIGIPTMVDLAKGMGISTWGDPNQYGLAVTLGAAEVKMTDMATVFGTLANSGERVDLNPVLKITDYKGNVLEQKDNPERTRIVPQSISYIMSNILADNNARSLEFGSNSPLVVPGHNVSVKTGTSDNKRDNWTIGYTKNYLVAVWVGNNDNSPMNPQLASGITGAAPIWNSIMSDLLKGHRDEPNTIPSDVVQKPCFGRSELFVAGTENLVNCRSISRTTLSPTPNP